MSVLSCVISIIARPEDEMSAPRKQTKTTMASETASVFSFPVRLWVPAFRTTLVRPWLCSGSVFSPPR